MKSASLVIFPASAIPLLLLSTALAGGGVAVLSRDDGSVDTLILWDNKNPGGSRALRVRLDRKFRAEKVNSRLFAIRAGRGQAVLPATLYSAELYFDAAGLITQAGHAELLTILAAGEV
ncbi:hypothetical protein BS329_16095 [Amycolatopsis coloradensis]|uniref:Uncharacterized protein n=1 Tax=Amycolatopsis coloradensis TaxID=76021 RepID=A0A1R0KTD8_9PSEU|nr:hypothetical protein BS329_16095 [Amycolatopsis coloradensis]